MAPVNPLFLFFRALPIFIAIRSSPIPQCIACSTSPTLVSPSVKRRLFDSPSRFVTNCSVDFTSAPSRASRSIFVRTALFLSCVLTRLAVLPQTVEIRAHCSAPQFFFLSLSLLAKQSLYVYSYVYSYVYLY